MKLWEHILRDIIAIALSVVGLYLLWHYTHRDFLEYLYGAEADRATIERLQNSRVIEIYNAKKETVRYIQLSPDERQKIDTTHLIGK